MAPIFRTAVQNSGMADALKALTYAVEWLITRYRAGVKHPDPVAVAEYWGCGVATAYRNQAAFRRCFPDYDDPAPLWVEPRFRELVLAGIGDEVGRRRTRKVEVAVARLAERRDAGEATV